jgi:hypothetical protein
MKEHKLRVLENGELKRILEHERKKERRDGMKLRNKELHNSYSLPNKPAFDSEIMDNNMSEEHGMIFVEFISTICYLY